jgi:hypothetical protein
MSTEITIRKEVSPVIDKAIGLVITNAEGMRQGVEILSQLNQMNDRIIEEREKVTKPLNEALKAERARWKPIEDQIKTAIAQVRKQMTHYQTEAIKAEREEEARIAARIGEGRGKLKMDTAIRKIEEIKRTENQMASDSGVVKFREVSRFEVIDIKALPIEYHLANEVAIREAMMKGIELPGVRYYKEMRPVNLR